MNLFGDVVVDDERTGFFEGESEAVEGRAVDNDGLGHGSSEFDIAGVDGEGGAGGVFVIGVFDFK